MIELSLECTNDDIRLVDGSTNREGRVEVCVDGYWGTVCGEGWGETEASLVCSKLGFPRLCELKFRLKNSLQITLLTPRCYNYSSIW